MVFYSVCIPTYGRPECIEMQLSGFTDILEKHDLVNEVELCISDNNADHETEKVVHKHMAAGKIKIRYLQQGKNVGYDRNVISVLKLATGEYVQLISDEGGPIAENIRGIVALAKNGSDGIFFRHRKTPKLKSPGAVFKSMLSPEGVKEYFGTVLGTFIVGRQHIQAFFEEHDAHLDAYIGKSFMHIPLFLYFLQRAQKLEVLEPADTGEAARNVAKIPKMSYPSDMSRIYVRQYFSIFESCRNTGILKEQDFLAFKKSFLSAIPRSLFKIRVMMPPQIYESESVKIKGDLEWLKGKYSTREAQSIALAQRLVMVKLLPYHLVYEWWAAYKKKVKKDKEFVDAFDFYRSSEKYQKTDF